MEKGAAVPIAQNIINERQQRQQQQNVIRAATQRYEDSPTRAIRQRSDPPNSAFISKDTPEHLKREARMLDAKRAQREKKRLAEAQRAQRAQAKQQQIQPQQPINPRNVVPIARGVVNARQQTPSPQAPPINRNAVVPIAQNVMNERYPVPPTPQRSSRQEDVPYVGPRKVVPIAANIVNERQFMNERERRVADWVKRTGWQPPKPEIEGDMSESEEKEFWKAFHENGNRMEGLSQKLSWMRPRNTSPVVPIARGAYEQRNAPPPRPRARVAPQRPAHARVHNLSQQDHDRLYANVQPYDPYSWQEYDDSYRPVNRAAQPARVTPVSPVAQEAVRGHRREPYTGGYLPANYGTEEEIARWHLPRGAYNIRYDRYGTPISWAVATPDQLREAAYWFMRELAQKRNQAL